MTKLNLTAVAVVVALLATGTATTIILDRDPVYTPPAHPNPTKILQEAQADTAAGRYQQALAKHIWYRNNAVRYDPGQVGVRDSFALSDWGELAEKYPPALKKLKAIRDDAAKRLRAPDGGAQAVGAAFITVVSIDNGLKENGKNVELFKWLDTHNPAAAKRVYPAEEKDLIEAGEYTLCGRYMDADRSYERILDMYNRTKSMGGEQLQQFAVKSFSNESARLVAVLAIDGRADEAARVSGEAVKVMGNPEFAALLAEARNGTVPPKWP